MKNGNKMKGGNKFKIVLFLLVLTLFLLPTINALLLGGKEGQFFNGTIDEVRVYNVSLTKDDVDIHYNSILYKSSPALWNFYLNQTGYDLGLHTYLAYAADKEGNVNETEVRSFTYVDNYIPTEVSDFRIQDASNDWDNQTIPDTHSLTPYINWTKGTDQDSTVYTLLCIASTAENRNNENCDIVNNMTFEFALLDDYYLITSENGINYDGTSNSYYARLISTDGIINSSVLDKTFNIINDVPVVSNFNTSVVHDNTPTVKWSVIDLDDGSKDHWPADSIAHYIIIKDSDNGSIYSESSSANNDSYTVDLLPWGIVDGDYANRTFDVDIWTNDGNVNSVNLSENFILTDYLPKVQEIFMTDVGAYTSCTESSCALTPISGSNTTVAVKIKAYDLDNDCDISNTAYFHLCLDSVVCNETEARYLWQVDSILRDNQNCTFSFSLNKTKLTPEFFIAPSSTYTYYLNITSQAGMRVSDDVRTGEWQYNSLQSISYSDVVILGDGDLIINNWNNGTSLAKVINYGNVLLNLSWYTSNPTNGEDTWFLNNTDLMIDDDVYYNDDVGLDSVFINGSSSIFNPINGLDICNTINCDDGALNETLDTYYHAYPQGSLGHGTYNSTMTITLLNNGGS